MKNVDIGIYVLLGITLIGFLSSSFLMIDTSILVPIIWALLGAVLGRNVDGVVAAAGRAVNSAKKN